MADTFYKDLIAPPFYGLWNDVVNRKYPEIWLAGGRGCVDGGTMLETPRGKIPISQFKGGEIYSYDIKLRRIVKAIAEQPKRYTIEKLYAVKVYGGEEIVVTDEHRFLTSNGWKMVKELQRDAVIVLGEHLDGISAYGRIEYIRYRKTDYYYDVNVIGTHNFIAHGFVNHNSTKSSFVSTCIPLLMEMNPKVHCVCFRKYGTNLADSVFSQFEYTINEKLKPIADHWLFKRSPLKIVNTNTKQQILFRGLDDPQKVKSLKAPFGYFGLIWLEELAEFDGIEEVRNVLQSLRRGGHWFQTFCSYNPPPSSSSWVNAEAATPQIVDGKLYRYVHHSDYRGVPREWLGDDFFVSAELLKKTNERAYRHEYLGEVTGNGGAVFPNAEAMEMSDEMISQFDNRRFGLDFGFSLDPCAFLGMHYDHNHRSLYIFDEIYEQNLTNIVLAEKLKEKKDEIGYNYIMCDSAEPKSIAELESFDVNVLPAKKGPDSIRFGIRWLQSLAHIYIDPVRCPNTWREFSQYEYEKNKSGLFISRYPDFNNHSIDACLAGDTLIQTSIGCYTISELVGIKGRCIGIDINSGQSKWVEFKNVRMTRSNAEVMRITCSDEDAIVCTPDHKILLYNENAKDKLKYKEAHLIKEGELIKGINRNFEVRAIEYLLSRQDVYDIEVPETSNFAIVNTIVNNHKFVHNCRYATEEDATNSGLF